MRLMDFILVVCKYEQERLKKNAVYNSSFMSSEEYLKTLYEGMLQNSVVEPREDGYTLAKGKVGGLEHLHDELKAGYWVFAFFFSTDFYEFKRFETEEDALTYYKSLTRDCFCGQKLLLKVGEAREGLM